MTPVPGARSPAVFVASRVALRERGGGQQLCTHEYLRTVRAAGFSPSIIAHDFERRVAVRLRRKLLRRPYHDVVPPTLAGEIIARAKSDGARFVFLNTVDLAPLAPRVRAALDGECAIVLLSHGLASVDYLHEIRGTRGGLGLRDVGYRRRFGLATRLIEECRQREWIDYVFCLAPFEAEIETWLGARKVTWLPRTVPGSALRWRPRRDRIGFVGTVDHPPNAEGLALFLREFERVAPADVRLRLVGGPRRAGERVARAFPIVEYLGPLDDAALETEAATWSCFVHPMFCYARGCSTKLATAVGWRIPVATTAAGQRGYDWGGATIPTADTPASLARLVVDLLDPLAAADARREVSAAAESAPTLPDVAALMAAALGVSEDLLMHRQPETIRA